MEYVRVIVAAEVMAVEQARERIAIQVWELM